MSESVRSPQPEQLDDAMCNSMWIHMIHIHHNVR